MSTSIQKQYETAQICESGHLITKHYSLYPAEQKPFCPICSSPTICECPSCHAKIQGCLHRIDEEFNLANCFFDDEFSCPEPESITRSECLDENAEYIIPAYCHNCGKPFPWMQANLDEIETLIAMSDDLTGEEKNQLHTLFPNLFTETPHTVSSAITTARLLTKLSPLLKDALKASVGDKIVANALKFLGW